MGSITVTSAGVHGHGEYDTAEGLIFSYPVTSAEGCFEIAQDRQLNDFARAKIKATEAELIEERDAVAHLL